MSSLGDRNTATLVHLGGIFFGFVPALAVWLIKKDASLFLTGQLKEALNFQITVALALLVCFALRVVLIGFLLAPVVFVANVLFCVLAAFKSQSGDSYRYPFSLRLLQ
ncbi:MAG: DUF4870 domain-containing protein [Betaproteobacteria bacterium]|nr:DUF4870 domain-containing protein [Betaproteobacteria bacterium]